MQGGGPRATEDCQVSGMYEGMNERMLANNRNLRSLHSVLNAMGYIALKNQVNGWVPN